MKTSMILLSLSLSPMFFFTRRPHCTQATREVGKQKVSVPPVTVKQGECDFTTFIWPQCISNFPISIFRHRRSRLESKQFRSHLGKIKSPPPRSSFPHSSSDFFDLPLSSPPSSFRPSLSHSNPTKDRPFYKETLLSRLLIILPLPSQKM